MPSKANGEEERKLLFIWRGMCLADFPLASYRLMPEEEKRRKRREGKEEDRLHRSRGAEENIFTCYSTLPPLDVRRGQA